MSAATAAVKEAVATAVTQAPKVRGSSGKWGRMRTFPTKHGVKLHKPVEIKQALLEKKVYLYDVVDLKLVWGKKGPGQTGLRHFKYELLPPLRYWNPDIKIESKKEINQDKFEPQLTATLGLFF